MRHRFFVSPDQLDGTLVRFSADQVHQLRHVLRLRAGDQVRVFDGTTPVDHVVTLTSLDAGRIDATRPQPAEPGTRLVVYPALLQRDKFEQVLQKLTEIGVSAIVPVLTARGLVREAPDAQRQTRWRAILREASEQSGRGVVPDLRPALSLSDALGQAVGEGLTLVAYEGERGHTLRQALADATSMTAPGSVSLPSPDDLSVSEVSSVSGGPSLSEDALRVGGDGVSRSPGSPAPGADTRRTVSLFVGSEGGFDPSEADAATASGARLITLGPRILRTETASPLFAALVLYELGDLSSPPP